MVPGGSNSILLDELFLLAVLVFVLGWLDWQLSTLFARGFKVAGLVEPFNVYPRIIPCAVESFSSLLDPVDADNWNNKIGQSHRPSDLDEQVFNTAQEQVERGLLSSAHTNRERLDFRQGKLESH